MARILIIEDEANLRFAIRQSFARASHEVAEAANVPEAIEHFRRAEFDAIVSDINLASDQSGTDFLRHVREEGFEGAFIIITAFGSVEKAVEAMKFGADDFLQKPISLQELQVVVERALDHRRMRTQLRLYERLEQSREGQRQILGQSPAWLSALALAERLAAMPLPRADAPAGAPVLPTILLLGETGSGKGVIARHIHATAQRLNADAATPFVHVNCAALPPTLIESELFGHEKGAFTDAKAARAGLFEMAEGGSIFLDEIGDMPADLQAKLLLVLEHGRFRRVGGSRERSVRARVIAATNQALDQRVDAGQFRRDLFYRLNAFTIRIPPLRERGDDALSMAAALLDTMSREHRRAPMTLNIQAQAAVRHHTWPGNVRELHNAVQRAVMLADSHEVGPADLGLSVLARRRIGENGETPAMSAPAGGPLVFDFEHTHYTADGVERELILQALRKVRGNVSKAAKLIGMNRSSLRYRIERCGLDNEVQELARQ